MVERTIVIYLEIQTYILEQQEVLRDGISMVVMHRLEQYLVILMLRLPSHHLL